MISRRFPVRSILSFGASPILLGLVWGLVVYVLYAEVGWEFLRIPFLPIATVGTAVAFYVGFKNNASYERFWEGRKIWGGIVNESRAFAYGVQAYLGDDSAGNLGDLRKQLIYRQLAWINALRLQLRRTSRFHDKPSRTTKRRLQEHAQHMRNDWDLELAPFLLPEELSIVSGHANTATHLMATQTAVLADLARQQQLEIFHQVALMTILRELTALQGMCERIKGTPFPRQYAEFSRLFVRVFVTLLPFGLLDVFADQLHTARHTDGINWVMIVPMLACSVLLTWVFSSMESIGDASEDPFERSMNDVPMNAICRTIEIDLRALLGEAELPAGETSKDGILY